MEPYIPIDEQLERLIVRCLDGEATPAESAELRARMAEDEQVRAVYDDYARLDGQAKAALTSVLTQPVTVAATRWRMARWFAASAGVMALAAAIGLLVSPGGLARFRAMTVGYSAPSWPAERAVQTDGPTLVSDEAVPKRNTLERLMPRRGITNVRQNWVGVFDPKTQQIYLLGVDQRDTRTMPVVYEH